LDEEIFSSYKLHQREESDRLAGQRQVRRRQIHQLQRTAEENAIAAILGDSPQFSQVVPLTEEITKYIVLVRVKILEALERGEVLDQLNFWADDDIKRTFPILCRIAAQVFAQEATSGDMERINSR